MRRFTIIIELTDDYIEEGQTIDNDLTALLNGDLTVDDLIELAKDEGNLIKYEVRDIKS